ncbi:Dishevelled associated activator of morphogenesis 2 [Glugoides intestinalis]
MEKYTRRFDIPHKIQTIASAFSFTERKRTILECLNDLKDRHSLVSLLFLRYTLEAILHENEVSNNGLWKDFESNNGISILKYSYRSVNRSFLNNLSELLIFIQKNLPVCYDFLPLLLKKYDLINKKLIFTFINLNIDRSALIIPMNIIKHEKEPFIIEEDTDIPCYCFTFLKRIVEDIFDLPHINDELKFLQLDGFEIEKVISKDKWIKSKSKFSSIEVYNRLLNFSHEKVQLPMKTENKAANSNTLKATIDCSGVCIREASNLPRQLDGKVSFIDQSKKKSELFVSNEFSTSSVELLKSDAPKITRAQKDADQLKKELELIKFENLTLKCKLDKEMPHKKVLSYSFNHAPTGINNVDCNNDSRTPLKEERVDTPKIPTLFKGKAGLFKKTAVQGPSKPVLEEKANISDSTASKIENTTQEISKAKTIFKGKGGLFGKKKVEEAVNSEVTKQAESKAPIKFSHRFGEKQKIQESNLSTTQSYIGLKWKKTNKAQSQIFAKIDYIACEKSFKLEEFEGFASKPEKKEVASLEVNKQGLEVQKAISCAIEPKKSYALNIALGRVKLSNEELIDKILKQEYENENIVRQLLTYFLTQEEYESVSSTTVELSRAEQLFKALPSLNEFHRALLSQRFTFAFKARDYQNVIQNMKYSFEKLIRSEEVPKLFGILLVIGNVLNSNKFNGNAEGFSLDSLEMFATKEVFEMIKKKVDCSKLLNELLGTERPVKILLVNSEISMETLLYEINEIKAVSGSFVSGDIYNEYRQVLTAFEDLFNLYKETQKYFGVSDDSFIPKLECFLRKLYEHL